MSTVYRVENPHNMGPYSDANYGSATVRMRADHNNGPAQLHPSPYVAMGVSMMRQPSSYKCAFNNMQSLFRWFGGWLPGLLKEGYHVAAIDDVAVKFGPDHTGQVIFDDTRIVPRG